MRQKHKYAVDYVNIELLLDHHQFSRCIKPVESQSSAYANTRLCELTSVT